MFGKARLRRGIRAADDAGPGALSPLVSADALPPGNWRSRDAATAPFTRKSWDRRARAAGLFISIRTFTEEGERVLRIQVRPTATIADAEAVLGSFEALLDKSHEAIIGRKALSHRLIPLSPDRIPGCSTTVAYESLLVRGLRGITVGAITGTNVVSVSAYGRTGVWTVDTVAAVLRGQVALLGPGWSEGRVVR